MNRWYLIGTLIFTLLAGCSTLSKEHPINLDTTALGDLSWNQRVKFTKTINRLRIYDVNNVLLSTQTFNPPVSYVDLPTVPGLSPLNVGATIEKAAFLTPLTTTEKNQYIRRGKVNVRFSDGTAQNLNPYGEVVSGELIVLASVQRVAGQTICQNFNMFISNEVDPPITKLETFGINLNTSTNICFAKFDIGDTDTTTALTALKSMLSPFAGYVPTVIGTTGLVVDRNVTSSVDPPARAFDPSCEQITKWLDPIGNNGFDLIALTKLLNDINVVTSNHTNQAVNVSVTIVGSGVGASDLFQCGSFFFDHDNHIRSIIHAIAPYAALRSETVCDANGVCPAGEIVKALMHIVRYAKQNASFEVLVNMSLGGPLADKPTYEMLEMLGDFAIPVISSGGNGPTAPSHFPATYSADVSSSPLALDNVLSVAAIGFKQNADGNGNSGYKIAGFNTRRNGGFFAPGVNTCPATATGFRCDSGAVFPDNLGLTGSSFAAPVVTGLAALYAEEIGHIPVDLSACLQSNVAIDPITSEDYVAFDNLSVLACQ
jgi:Subtilase family